MLKSLYAHINSKKTINYTLILYLIVIFVLSSLNFKTTNHGLIYKDKIIHFVEYFILGILFIRYFIFSKNIKFKRSMIFTLLFGSLYAVSDEIHQGFVGFFSTGIFGGVRDPDILDVFADIVGILAGIYTYSIILIKYNKINGKLNEEL
ncbi:MAG: VanZ family protein [Candidatus Delongbacteria bacterium]|nr:VanZ family protein [Candidatus Delongbacteria bacterium]